MPTPNFSVLNLGRLHVSTPNVRTNVAVEPAEISLVCTAGENQPRLDLFIVFLGVGVWIVEFPSTRKNFLLRGDGSYHVTIMCIPITLQRKSYVLVADAPGVQGA